MNRLIRLINILLASLILIVTLILSFVGFAHAVDHVCDKANPITINAFEDPPAKLRGILEHYKDYEYLRKNYEIAPLLNKGVDEAAYCIVFEHYNNMPLAVKDQKIVFENKDDNNVYIIGLKLKSKIGDTLFEVVHKGGPGKIILKNVELTDVRDGLFLDAEETFRMGTLIPKDAIQVINSEIVGANKDGNCLTVKCQGAILDNVTARNCAEGVRVEARNVGIVNSHIFDNKIGIFATTGSGGTDIEKSQIYANDDGNDEPDPRFDGILFDPQVYVLRDLSFWDVIDGDRIERGDQEDVIVYEDRPVYIVLPEMQDQNSKAELLMAEQGDCNVDLPPYGQPCKTVIDWPKELSAEILNEKRYVEHTLDKDGLNKNLVATFYSRDKGITAISQKFSIVTDAEGGIVVFVQTPFDIPTPGSDVAEGSTAGGPEEEEEDLELGMGGDEIYVESADQLGGGLGIGPPAAKCSLMSGESFRTVCVGFDLWWLIFTAALIGTVRTVLVRITDRKGW